ncbi:hypothetical protein BDV37DRAFT_290513 [Aspergillus pseudonomiae]|uniref:Glycosyl hydrolase n=1 Tax=Aspergillus pseudonomiae TaxID=1506151 RepID=A0A5N7CXY2_9EURO|nr:uncharacterized protein BDV37DRAFT_290513 [Aspergillus pseudonomiae]KAE8399056.1 hypothetical protein BDV37DRAFT_290513 [Aspergillus pseudonomiae]
MRILSSVLAVANILTLSTGRVIPRQDGNSYVGYLLSTFSDANPSVFWYLSEGSDPLAFKALNGGSPVLESTVGTRAVRDVFLASNAARSEYFIIATDLDINAEGFSWDEATRRGSRGLTIWKSDNLVDWSEPTLTTIEEDTAGMAWAPSAVWNDDEQQYYLFWASRLYDPSDSDHTGTAGLDRIRYSTTKDFVTFSSPADYVALDGIPLIDQEFLELGTPGAYAQTTTGGLFGEWTRIPGYIGDNPLSEGPASFPDIENSELYHLFLDNYEEYVPFQTSDINAGSWEKSSTVSLPSGLKHGSVLLLTQSEYDTITSKYATN